ncbi:hypothetical protein [Rhizobium sp. P44RR-XXIV]|uniref:hypothetical protein n=1 Tax=Rhizobium sp. P44RR-XXIV TaxID=1921145 RepID=UPI0009875562|nr:hypothetical protein [Rhizobium sp. P44RR-XXIV]TIX93551.1 hypothetical protein BSK43_000435 [Rhizobium sp. P44RR-XXIV]
MSENNLTQERRAHSVVYSFFSRWEEPLRSENVRVFFRKRFPSKLPNRVYFYIGAPVKSIIGSASVSDIKRLHVQEALDLSSLGCITKAELANYLGERESVGAIYLDDFEFFPRPVGLLQIENVISFSPPQNFQNLDAEEEQMLKELAR